MALATLANVAAALAAGYKEVVLDRGASFTPAAKRFEVLLEKQLVGEPASQGDGTFIRALGQGLDQASAETVALAALNNQRLHRYGADTGTASKGGHGGQHTIDVS